VRDAGRCYPQLRPINDNDLEALRRIDALFTARPFYETRRIARILSEGAFRSTQSALGAAGAQDLSLSFCASGDRPLEPGLGGRPKLHPN